MAEGFIITYYKTSELSEGLLEKAIDLISKGNYYVVLASHTPVSEKLQSKCDFYLFQEENIVDNRKWSHGVAENNLLELALLHLRWKRIKWTYKVCYTNIFVISIILLFYFIFHKRALIIFIILILWS